MAVSTKTRLAERLLLRMIGQEEIGRRIREARDEADLSQQELAEAIGLGHAQSISRYERGETEVPTKRLKRIAEATGRPMGFFMQGAEETENVTVTPDLLERLEVAVGALAGEAARLAEIVERLERLPRDEAEQS